jgi:hypothetical protein
MENAGICDVGTLLALPTLGSCIDVQYWIVKTCAASLRVIFLYKLIEQYGCRQKIFITFLLDVNKYKSVGARHVEFGTDRSQIY